MVCSAISFSSLVGAMPNRSSSSFTNAARTSFCSSMTLPKRLYLGPSASSSASRATVPSSRFTCRSPLMKASTGSPFFCPAILGMGDGQLAHQRAVLDAHDEQIDVAAVESFEATLQGFRRRCGFKLVEHRDAMCGQKRVSVDQVLHDEALVFEFLLHRAHEYTKRRSHRGTSEAAFTRRRGGAGGW